MEYRQARNMAFRVAREFSSLDMPFEDRVQECLLKWAELKDKNLPNTYIFAAMKNRMVDIGRKEIRERKALAKIVPPSSPSDPLTLLIEAERGPVVVPIPARMRVTRQFVRLLIEVGMDLGEACKRSKITYETGALRWAKAKKIARRLVERGTWKPEDILVEVTV